MLKLRERKDEILAYSLVVCSQGRLAVGRVLGYYMAQVLNNSYQPYTILRMESNMKPSNSFIDESAMKAEGEPLEYIPVFSRHVPGLIVKEISREEWDSAIFARDTARCGADAAV